MYIQKVYILEETGFEWDERKNRANLGKHGLDFRGIPPMFAAPMIAQLDMRRNYGEDRWIAIGLLRNNILVVVFTERRENTIRIISARKAKKHEREAYETEGPYRLG